MTSSENPTSDSGASGESIACPTCGHGNRAGRKFCSQCGNRFQPVCPECGERNEIGDQFCGECGTSLGATATPGTSAEVSAPESSAQSQPTSTPAVSEAPTSVSQGRYRIERFLGEGAKKRVFLARDTRLDRQVAVAIIKREGLDSSGVARVRREAEAMGRLGDHPNVVTVFDVEEEGDSVFIVSRYVAGGDVEAQLREAPDHWLAVLDALRISADIARALAHAHEREIVHRDVKPGNVWLDTEGTALLGDFGLAALGDRPRLTQEGTMLGTVAYMPPEQALGRPADARSDLYSLGALLYELLAGRPPFPGEDTVGVIAQHINSPPVRPSWHRAGIPRELDELVLRLLSKSPDDRPANARLVAEALDSVRASEATRSSSIHDSRSQETLPPATLGLFVGRDRELAQLQEVFARVLAGEGAVAMVVGEPGIGKTRLTKEFMVHAKLRSARVFMGPCYEGEGSMPYQPFVEALRQYIRDVEDDDTLRAQLGDGAPELATLMPDLRSRFPDLPEAEPLEGEAERQRLFDSMAAFTSRASQGAPLVLVLDDLHWADKPTLLLLLYLARRIRHDRVLLLGTYRDVELDRTHPLAETVATMRSDGLYERILLRGLDLKGIQDLLQARAGHEIPLTVVEPVLRETEGNPFFVEEVIKHLVEVAAIRREDGRWVADLSDIERSIPEGVREVIGHRLSRLSAECNAMLTIGAAMSGGFHFELLARVSDEHEDKLLDHLDEALRAQVILERGEGPTAVYEFSHALIRQTLYQELSTPRRVRLHRQIGDALESLHGIDSETHCAELAYHFFQGAIGGDVDKAIDTSLRAAERARSTLAWEEVAGHLSRALEALEIKGTADDRQSDLLFTLGEAQRLAGERDASRATLMKVVEHARERADNEGLARAALAYAAEDATVQFDTPDVIALTEEGLSVLDPRDSELRVRLMSRLSIGLIFGKDPERTERIGREAVDMARRLGDPETLCRALVIYRIVRPLEEDLEEAVAVSREMMALAEQVGASELALNARFSHIFCTIWAGDGAAVDEAIDEYGRLSAQLRQPSMLWFAASQQAMLALARGPLDEAQQRIDEARDVGARGQHPLAPLFHAAQNAALEILTGPAGNANDRLLELWASPVGRAADRGTARALSLLRAGREGDAREAFEESARQHFKNIPRDGPWLGRMASAAEACILLRDVPRARELYDFMAPYADFVPLSGPASMSYAPVPTYLGRLAALDGRLDLAVTLLERGLQKLERLGFRVHLVQSQLHLAETLRMRDDAGDRSRALAIVNQALAQAESLGMKPAVEQALALKLDLQGTDFSSVDVKQSIYVVADAVEARKQDLGTHAAPDGTVTLLFSDMQGFTTMTEELGDLKARDVIREHNQVVREQLAAHGGYEVELQGDGFLLAFGSARQGLYCAIEIQRAFAARNLRQPENPIHVRIGVHTGEALKDADKFFGRSVILAARIADQAQGGEILSSSIVRELTSSTGDIHFGSEREVALKGIALPQRLVLVDW